jgi:hypothetical protein
MWLRNKGDARTNQSAHHMLPISTVWASSGITHGPSDGSRTDHSLGKSRGLANDPD